MRSWVRVKRRRIVTSPSFAVRIMGHSDGFAIGIPRRCSNRGPVNKSTTIAVQTTIRNRRAVVRKSTDFCDANGSRLSTGTSTRDKKIVPPIQLTAATRWSHMRREAPIIRHTLDCDLTGVLGRRLGQLRLLSILPVESMDATASLTSHKNLLGNCLTNDLVRVSAMR